MAWRKGQPCPLSEISDIEDRAESTRHTNPGAFCMCFSGVFGSCFNRQYGCGSRMQHTDAAVSMDEKEEETAWAGFR